jgi:DNA-directed RNA polymerase subunit RPC12/RpoP
MKSYARGSARFSRLRPARGARPVTECAQCGQPIYIPEWSEWLDTGQVRHLWQCTDCGYSFETTIYFAAA